MEQNHWLATDDTPPTTTPLFPSRQATVWQSCACVCAACECWSSWGDCSRNLFIFFNIYTCINEYNSVLQFWNRRTRLKRYEHVDLKRQRAIINFAPSVRHDISLAQMRGSACTEIKLRQRRLALLHHAYVPNLSVRLSTTVQHGSGYCPARIHTSWLILVNTLWCISPWHWPWHCRRDVKYMGVSSAQSVFTL